MSRRLASSDRVPELRIGEDDREQVVEVVPIPPVSWPTASIFCAWQAVPRGRGAGLRPRRRFCGTPRGRHRVARRAVERTVMGVAVAPAQTLAFPGTGASLRCGRSARAPPVTEDILVQTLVEQSRSRPKSEHFHQCRVDAEGSVPSGRGAEDRRELVHQACGSPVSAPAAPLRRESFRNVRRHANDAACCRPSPHRRDCASNSNPNSSTRAVTDSPASARATSLPPAARSPRISKNDLPSSILGRTPSECSPFPLRA